jgi:hypothetical protein
MRLAVTRNRPQPLLVGQRMFDRNGQPARLRRVIERMDAVDQRLMPFDGRMVDQRDRAASERLVMAEAVPAEPLR